MITKIGDKDRFGYDGNRPVAAQLSSNTIAFGYNFCGRLKITTEAGFQDTHHLYVGGRASILILNPKARLGELWFGNWQQDENTYHIVNASYVGIADTEIQDIEAAKTLLSSGTPIPYRAGYLSTSVNGQPLAAPDISADQELNLRLSRTPVRSFVRHFKTQALSEGEKQCAMNLEFLLNSLCTYVFRFDAASKLSAYVDAMHFSRPEFIPLSRDKFLVLSEWKQIAARDAAFSLFHFLRTFEFIREQSLKDAPTLRGTTDIAKLRLAWNLYRSQFEDTIPMRHAIGHSAEFYRTQEARAFHSGHKDIFIESMMIDSVLSVSADGKFVSVDMAQAAVDKLDKIKTLILEAFDGALDPVKPRGQ